MSFDLCGFEPVSLVLGKMGNIEFLGVLILCSLILLVVVFGASYIVVEILPKQVGVGLGIGIWAENWSQVRCCDIFVCVYANRDAT